MKLIDLNPMELINAAHLAGMIRGVKKVQLDRGDVRNRRVADMDDFGMHYLGMLGEVAVARELGVPVRSDITVYGDGSTDIELHGQRLQIKTSGHSALNRKRLVYLNSIDEFQAQWLIACSLQGPSRIGIHGFISRGKFEGRHHMHDFGYGARVCVKESDLTDIGRILEAIPKIGKV